MDMFEAWDPVTTTLQGVRVPKPLGARLVLKAIYESNFFAVAVADDEVETTRQSVTCSEGMNLCPEGAACVAALRRAKSNGSVGPDDRVVVFNTASGLKSSMPAAPAGAIEQGASIDWQAFTQR